MIFSALIYRHLYCKYIYSLLSLIYSPVLNIDSWINIFIYFKKGNSLVH